MATQTVETTTAVPAAAWSIEKARALYNIEGWGAGFFDIDERGHVVVRPDKEHPERQLSLHDLANDLEEQGVALPVLLRFSDILRSRIEALSERFQNAIQEYEYKGSYTTVYPIKVNQQRHVVEEIVQFGAKHGVGLECGVMDSDHRATPIDQRTVVRLPAPASVCVGHHHAHDRIGGGMTKTLTGLVSGLPNGF